MTYKRADRPGWPRLRAQRFVCQRLCDGRLNGYATLLQMVEVAEPLWVTHHDRHICIADAGYSWLQIFPEGTNYTHTTMFNADGQPVQEYIDLVAEHGVDDMGIPWYDDLYLDITWIPEGDGPLLLDQEELEAAHAIGAITPEQYDLARGETARLLLALTLGDYPLPEVARACYPALKAAIDASEATAAAGADETGEAPTIISDEVVASADAPETPETPAADATPAITEEPASAIEPERAQPYEKPEKKPEERVEPAEQTSEQSEQSEQTVEDGEEHA